MSKVLEQVKNSPAVKTLRKTFVTPTARIGAERTTVFAPGVTQDAVRRYLESDGCLQRTGAPLLKTQVLSGNGGFTNGESVVKQVWYPPFLPESSSTIFDTRHSANADGTQHEYTQTLKRGMFADLDRTLTVSQNSEGAVQLHDTQQALLKYGTIISTVGEDMYLQRKLQRSQAYMHAVMATDLEDMAAKKNTGKGKRVAISGASGLIGQALVPFLLLRGHEVTILNRHSNRRASPFDYMDDVRVVGFNPYDPEASSDALEEQDVLINLNGKNVNGLWTDAFKKACLRSRVDTTRNLVAAVNRCESPPKLFLTASGISVYDALDRKSPFVEQRLEVTRDTENDPSLFMQSLALAWEKASLELRDDVRRVVMRLSPVMTPSGGVLGQLKLPFGLGFGGTIGPGTQRMSWVAIDDAMRAIDFLMDNDTLEGAVNVTSPQPVMSGKFTSALARTLHRPHIIPLPTKVLEYGGQFTKELLLMDQNVKPGKLAEAGFKFRYPGIDDALNHLLQGVECDM